MSVKASTWAWQMPLKGAEKLVLLALADHANDEGRCWPKIDSIAEKCGLSRTPVIEHIKKFQELNILSKEIIYSEMGGKKGNIYTLNIGLSMESLRNNLIRMESLRKERLRKDLGGDKSGFTPPLSQESLPLYNEEPSMNHQEPSITHPSDVVDQPEKPADPLPHNADEKKIKSKTQSPCPYDDLIALYHKLCPLNTVMRERTKTRDDHLRARWREYPDLAWWEQFFEIVAESKFLTGRVSARDRRPFVADLPWLTKPENFVKVLEGKYDA